MTIDRRVIEWNDDSWAGEMTYRGKTFLVEAGVELRKRNGQWGTIGWGMEVMTQWRFVVTVEHYSVHPTLEEALQAAEQYIRERETER